LKNLPAQPQTESEHEAACFVSSREKKASHQGPLEDYNLTYVGKPVEGKLGHYTRSSSSTDIQNIMLNCSSKEVTAHSAHSD